jgi:hypothetical protein
LVDGPQLARKSLQNVTKPYRRSRAEDSFPRDRRQCQLASVADTSPLCDDKLFPAMLADGKVLYAFSF